MKLYIWFLKYGIALAYAKNIDEARKKYFETNLTVDEVMRAPDKIIENESFAYFYSA